MTNREETNSNKHSLTERLTLAKEIGKVLPEVIIQEGLGIAAIGGFYTTIGAGLASWGFFLADKPEYTKIAAITEACGLGAGLIGIVGFTSLVMFYHAMMGENDRNLPVILPTDHLKSCIEDYKSGWL